jgi:hypothetical protein
VLAALQPYVGQNVILDFKITIPQNFSGPGFYALDDVSLNVTTSPTYSIVWSSPAITAGFGNVTNALLPPGTIPVSVPPAASPSVYNGTISISNGYCSDTKNLSVTINPVPTAIATPSSQSICSGSAITTIALTGNVTGTVFNWTRDNPVIVTGIGANGSGNITGSLTNTTNAPVTVTFTVTTTANGCPGSTTTATIVVNPSPVVDQPANQVLCNNSLTTAVNFSSPSSGGTLVYNWNNNATSIGLPAHGTGNIASFNAVNLTNAPIVATVTVTPDLTDLTNTFSNPAFINILDNSGASPYPSTLVVSGLPVSGATVQNVKLFGFNHTWAGDVGVVLQNPTNTKNVILFSNLGNDALINSSNVNLTFSDNATNLLSTNSPMASGTYKCTNYNVGAYNFFLPGPQGVVNPSVPGYPTLSTFTGDMNGIWKLFVEDKIIGNIGNIYGGYSITFNNPSLICTGMQKTFTYTVNPTPVVNVIPNQIVCNNSPTSAINFTSPTTGGTIVYNWTNNTPSIGLAAIGSGNIASFTATNATNLPVTATITVTPSFTNAGVTCTGSPITFTIKVNPLPVPVITSNTGIFSICNQSSITLNAGAFAHYIWSTGAITQTIAVNSGNTYTVTVTDLNGCTASATTTTVLNLSVPSKPGVISGPAAGMCGRTGTYSISPVPTATSYLWTVTGGGTTTITNTQGTTSVNITFGTFINATVSVKAINACGQSSARTLAVISKPTPPLTIYGNKNGVCKTNGLIYSTDPVFGAGSYNWTVPANVTLVSGQGTNAITVNFLTGFSSGNICVRAANSCGNSTFKCITVNGKPQTPVSINGPANVCANQTGVVYSTPSVAGATSYLWSVPPQAIIVSGQGTPSIVVNFGHSAGEVEVLAINACGTSSDYDLDIHFICREAETGEIILNEGDITAFPNPVHENLNVNIVSEVNQKCIIRLVDIVGKELMFDSFNLVKGGINLHQYPVRGYAEGLYLMIIEREGLPSQTIRVIVE